MSYKQVKAFNQTKAGKIKNFCLRNVRLGYGAPSKYSTAWEAWKHTEQHKDSNIPKGVDVPVYFSYWAWIDKQYRNWGHIGVRLANGKFWSDGKTYANIKTYTNTYKPKYVGWGESVNGVKVIKQEAEGDEMLTSKNHLKALTRQFLGKDPSKDLLGYIGKPYAYAVDKFHKARIDLPTVLKQNEKLAKALQTQDKRIEELGKSLDIRDKEIKKLKSQKVMNEDGFWAYIKHKLGL